MVNKSIGWIQIVITILIVAFGVVKTSGQRSQLMDETTRKVEACEDNLEAIQADQIKNNKEIMAILTELKMAVVELKTELRLSQKR